MINPFLKRINGLGCSVFYLLDHIRYGLSPSYLNNANEWIGIEGIIDRLNYTQEEMSKRLGISLRQYVRIDNEEDLPRRDV